MAGLRAYLPPQSSLHPGAAIIGPGSVLSLPPGESAHLVRSLRARPGEPIEVFDGIGRLWRGTVQTPDPRALSVNVQASELVQARHPRLVLAQAIPKGGLMDDIVRAAVELDAAEIHPICAARCEVRLDPPRAAARHERWLSIAIEACKQSGNPHLPHISPPTPLKTWLATETASGAPPALRLIGSLEPDARPLASLDTSPALRAAERLLLLIGPEGDLAPDEHALARSLGFLPIRFGNNVLRVPTAAHYALAALDQLRQRLP
ncbi:MAG: 16S rRNA (uracil(1498)-N(3))-methyltransferase [Puniceicoccales bacterium]|jgi:16S rRNA (uracil1498-N3)-methyltransferase|nr:16S rRNA (uracil(1498)-N(3))-methyltransferase [Puniceicoccales bacterium]